MIIKMNNVIGLTILMMFYEDITIKSRGENLPGERALLSAVMFRGKTPLMLVLSFFFMGLSIPLQLLKLLLH